MRMYIANCTKQNHVFTYRVPDSEETLSRPRALEIKAGSQIRLPDDLNQSQIDAIVEQYARYGMVELKEIDRKKDFAGLCYNIDCSVNIDTIRVGLSHNDQVLRELGAKMRQEAGVAAFQKAEQIADEAGIGLNSVELSVVEDNPDKNDSTREGDPVAEGVRVNRNEEPGPTKGKSMHRRR